MLCSQCVAFFSEEEHNRRGSTKFPSPADWGLVNAELHQMHDVVGLAQNPARGCELCAFLLAALRDKAAKINSTIAGKIHLATNPGGRSKTRRAQICHLIASAEVEDIAHASAIVEIEIELEECKVDKYDTHLLDLFASRLSKGDSNTGSCSSFHLAAWWLKECQNNHKRCHQTASPLPRRVIDVGLPDGSVDPYVYESQGETAPYVALSHCWGSISPLTTTNATLLQRKHKTGLDELPKTFRDAVIITRELGIRYLWIDSLCILQDSAEDWHTESSKMCSIYQNSTFTIAAAHAKDGSEGCFAARNGFLGQPHLFLRPRLGAEPSLLIARLGVDSALTAGHISPLSTRAWAYQEEMLSRRVLYYGAGGLAWRCCTAKASEAYPDFSIGEDDICRFQQKFLSSPDSKYRADIDPLDRFDFKDFNNNIGKVKESQSSSLSSSGRMLELNRQIWSRINGDSKEELPFSNDAYYIQHLESGPLRRSKWHEIVEEYTSRCLSRQSDRLAALAGISYAIGRLTREECIAGIWQSRSGRGIAVFDLLWHVKQNLLEQKHGESVPNHNPSVENPIAPSWSWASLNKPINYPHHGGVFLAKVAMEAHISKSNVSQLSGCLKGKGLLRKARIMGQTDNPRIGIATTEDTRSAPFLEGSGVKWLPDEPLTPGMDIWLLEIVHTEYANGKPMSDPRNTVYALGLCIESNGSHALDESLDDKTNALDEPVDDETNALSDPAGDGIRASSELASGSRKKLFSRTKGKAKVKYVDSTNVHMDSAEPHMDSVEPHVDSTELQMTMRRVGIASWPSSLLVEGVKPEVRKPKVKKPKVDESEWYQPIAAMHAQSTQPQRIPFHFETMIANDVRQQMDRPSRMDRGVDRLQEVVGRPEKVEPKGHYLNFGSGKLYWPCETRTVAIY